MKKERTKKEIAPEILERLPKPFQTFYAILRECEEEIRKGKAIAK
jgi:hypothetical protein